MLLAFLLLHFTFSELATFQTDRQIDKTLLKCAKPMFRNNPNDVSQTRLHIYDLLGNLTGAETCCPSMQLLDCSSPHIKPNVVLPL